MTTYEKVVIIYNPNSTGPSKDMAMELARRLRRDKKSPKVQTIPTKQQGHAEEIAEQVATDTKHSLIVMSSGDGGYHEVVNGVMKSRASKTNPVLSLLPAGNANDHFRCVWKELSDDLPTIRKVRKLDVLKIEIDGPDGKLHHYAHSYGGIGITAKVGKQLNQEDLNPLKEAWIVARSFLKLRATRVLIDKKLHKYDSFIFSTIPNMSKVVGLSDKAKLDDGTFEVSQVYSSNKILLLHKALKSVLGTIGSSKQVKKTQFQTVKPTLMQLDGEIYHLQQGAKVTVSIEQKALLCA